MSRRRRAQRALERQLSYQENKAQAIRGNERETIVAMMHSSQRVRELLEEVGPINSTARVLEVGSGAHGLIFFFGLEKGIGVDPLAHFYAPLFSGWQRQAHTVAAFGESLPFADHSFDVVLCDNVVDHAESPNRIVKEIARVLIPAGLLYFTVNIHHPIYGFAAQAHSTWNALGIQYEIGPFADHTVHLTRAKAEHLFKGLPFRIVRESADIEQAKAIAKRSSARHFGDRLKRIFFKNALYEVVAVRE
jgi:SAM-dependent methyltransferase